MFITPLVAHLRSEKGWDTRRKNDPNLRNIEKRGKDSFVWNRPNGESVPIHGFNEEQVQAMSHAFRAVDNNLQQDRRLNMYIQGNVPRRWKTKGKVLAGAARTANTKGTPSRIAASIAGVSYHDIGKTNSIKVNKDAIEKRKGEINLEGVVAHEIGHVVGPGEFSRRHFKNAEGRDRAEEFGKSFQWSPRTLNESSRRLDRHSNWKRTRSHPADSHTMQSKSYEEDFAESFRSLLGVPIHQREQEPRNHYHWRDTKDRSRERYVVNYHFRH